MKEVDARGLSCPEPLMLTIEALKSGEEVKVLVTEPHQKNNVEKLASGKGKKFRTKDEGDYFEIVISN